MKGSARRLAIAVLGVTGTLAALPVPSAHASVPCTYGLCVITTSDSGVGSLRQAILDANNLADTDTIVFHFTGSGVHVITPTSDLPVIKYPVVIDGYTDAGAVPATATTPATLTVTINGTNMATGLTLQASDSVITGLVVNRAAGTSGRCGGVGICVLGDRDTVRGNYVGIGHASKVAEPNLTDGIKVTGADDVIGGTGLADRNVISANTTNGIELTATAARCVIEGNLIGTDDSATTGMGNATGVLVRGSGAQLGGTDPAARNVVSGNTVDGVRVAAGTRTTIAGNLIGVTGDGLGELGNTRYGVWLNGASDTQLGVNGAGNTIAGNHDDGIHVTDGDVARGNVIAANLVGLTAVNTPGGVGGMPNRGDGISVETHGLLIGGDLPGDGNLIGTNGQNGILLAPQSTQTVVHGNVIGADSTGAGGLGNGWDGIQILDSTANEIGSADPAVPPNVITSNRRGVYVTGPLSADNPILGNSIHDNAGLGIELNPNLMTSPVATTVTATGGTTSITWHVVVAANTRYRLEWFASTACDGSGSGEGTTFLDFREFTTKNLTDVFIPTTVTEPSGTVITATLTVMLSPTTYGSTSEFSPCVTVP